MESLYASLKKQQRQSLKNGGDTSNLAVPFLLTVGENMRCNGKDTTPSTAKAANEEADRESVQFSGILVPVVRAGQNNP